MKIGRCSGCGWTSTSIKVIKRHVLECPEYRELFQESPERCLHPHAEYERYRLEDDSQEARELKRERRVARAVAAEEIKWEEQAERWATPDDLLA